MDISPDTVIKALSPARSHPNRRTKIVLQTGKEMWGDQYQIIVTTHLDKDHLHNHFFFNSVSFLDGKKYNYSKAEQSELKDRIPALENELENIKIKTEGLQRVIDKTKQVTCLEALTPELVHEFIEKIVVSAPEYKDASVIRRLKSTTTVLALSESHLPKIKWKNTLRNTSAESLS